MPLVYDLLIPLRYTSRDYNHDYDHIKKASALPPPLRRSSGHLTLSLSLSSPSSSSYTSPLLTLTVPSKRLLPVQVHRHDPSLLLENEPSFRLRDEIEWTFRKEEKKTSGVIGSIAAVVIVAQVGWLGIMVRHPRTQLLVVVFQGDPIPDG